MIDVTKPLIDKRTGAVLRYVGVGTARYPIVCVCPTVGASECVRAYDLRGNAMDRSSSIINPDEPEDWS